MHIQTLVIRRAQTANDRPNAVPSAAYHRNEGLAKGMATPLPKYITPADNISATSRSSQTELIVLKAVSETTLVSSGAQVYGVGAFFSSVTGFSQAPGPGDEVGRKRTFSSVSNGELNAPTDTRASAMAWSTELQPTAPSSSTPERPINTYQTNGLAPRPISLKPDTPPKPAATVLDAMSGDLPELSQPRDLDEDLFNGYVHG
jgi:hypothetical protein